MRVLAKAYAVVVVLALAFAWYVDISERHSAREHLMGDFVLLGVSLPTSLSLGPFYDAWPELANKPFVQVAYVSLCAVAQVILLFAAARWLAPLEKNEYWRRFWS
jgi:hypothetical protein